MFKIEVTKPSDSSVHGFYWMNKHQDDFAQFLPAQMTRELGEVITKDDIVIIKIDEAQKDVLEGKLSVHEKNTLDCVTAGAIRVCRHSPAKGSGIVPLAEFNALKAERESEMAGAVTPQTVTVPATIQHDFGSGAEDAIDLTGNELESDALSLELELTGTAIAWPYDVNGNFTGNN